MAITIKHKGRKFSFDIKKFVSNGGTSSFNLYTTQNGVIYVNQKGRGASGAGRLFKTTDKTADVRSQAFVRSMLGKGWLKEI